MKQRYIIMSLHGVVNDHESILKDKYVLTSKVDMLKEVCDTVGANLCILGINTREKPDNAKYFYDRMFRQLGFKKGIAHFFLDSNDFLGWLIKNSSCDYVILSADNSFKRSTERQVIYTNPAQGLQKTDIAKIETYFNHW